MILPQELLPKTYWSFNGKPFEKQENFSQAVADYCTAIKEAHVDLAEHWQPEELALPNCTKVCIIYEGLDETQQELDEKAFTIETQNPHGFTNSELLFLIHNQICEELSKIDHCFFEGLDAIEGGEFNSDPNIPTYYLCQGS